MKISIPNTSNQIVLMTSEQLQELVQAIQELKKIVQQKSSKQDFPELLRTIEVKRILKIGESSLAGLRQNGTIPFIKIGGTIYYQKKDLLNVINANYSGQNEEI